MSREKAQRRKAQRDFEDALESQESMSREVATLKSKMRRGPSTTSNILQSSLVTITRTTKRGSVVVRFPSLFASPPLISSTSLTTGPKHVPIEILTQSRKQFVRLHILYLASHHLCDIPLFYVSIEMLPFQAQITLFERCHGTITQSRKQLYGHTYSTWILIIAVLCHIPLLNISMEILPFSFAWNFYAIYNLFGFSLLLCSIPFFYISIEMLSRIELFFFYHFFPSLAGGHRRRADDDHRRIVRRRGGDQVNGRSTAAVDSRG